MICIKKDREVEFLPQTSDESGNLANPHELTLALGRTNYDGHVEFPGSGEHRFQQHQVRNVKMADCRTIFLCFTQEIP
jgi:hypothetical protein